MRILWLHFYSFSPSFTDSSFLHILDIDAEDHDEHYSSKMDVQTASPSPQIEPKAAPAPTDENAPEPARSHKKDEAALFALRLLHSSEDGGMLIGKDGSHINNLKESTNASWRIHGNNANQEDRIVVINGSIASIAHAVCKLAEHMDQQQMAADASSRNSNSDSLCLRFLFPGNCIGSILGPGGSRLSSIRQTEPDITWLHIYHGFVPQTNERIIEAVGPAQALGRVAEQLLQLSKESLTRYQETSRLYRPVRNGLHRMISRERDIQNGSSTRSLRKGPSTSFSNASGSDYDDDAEGEGRKRSYSMVNPSKHMDVCNDDDRGYKRPRRLSDNTHSRRSTSSHYHHHNNPQHERSNGSKHRSNHSRNRSMREEKLVVPDNIAGRLIGRNGACLISMESQSGAQITLSPRIPNMPDRIVTVVGSSKDVSTACRLIKDKVHIFEDMDM